MSVERVRERLQKHYEGMDPTQREQDEAAMLQVVEAAVRVDLLGYARTLDPGIRNNRAVARRILRGALASFEEATQ